SYPAVTYCISRAPVVVVSLCMAWHDGVTHDLPRFIQERSKVAKAKQQPSKELGAARYAALTSRAVTDAANALIDELMEIIIRYETRWGARHYSRGSKKQDDFRRAVQGIV